MPEQSPNILIITSDQQHWRALGFRNDELQTPHLDRLAAQGIVFNRCYTANPTCTPTRASMITGKYPSQHGAWALGTKLPEDEHTVGEDFSAAGYQTALVGKCHLQPLQGTAEFSSLEAYPTLQDLDFWRDFHGPFYGFDHVELARNHADEAHIGQHYAIWLEENGCSNWRDYFRPPTGSNEDQKHTWLIPERYHYDYWIAERCNALLESYAQADKNFLLWASFFDPHPPYLVPEPWDKLYDPERLTVPALVPGEHDNNPPHFQLTQQENPDFEPWRESGQWMPGMHSHLHKREELAQDIAVYYGMISMVDKYIGSILDKLEQLGLTEDTVVLFTTDHGHFYGHHGLIAKGPFHYEDLIKVPFIARYPGKIAAGQESAALLSLVDLAPTLLHLAGLETPRAMTGLNQADVLLGRRSQIRDHVIVENHQEPTTIHHKTYVSQRYKLTVYYNQDYGELFDLHQDPGEIDNLWNNPEYAELQAELVKQLLFAEMGKEPLWMPRIAVA